MTDIAGGRYVVVVIYLFGLAVPVRGKVIARYCRSCLLSTLVALAVYVYTRGSLSPRDDCLGARWCT